MGGLWAVRNEVESTGMYEGVGCGRYGGRTLARWWWTKSLSRVVRITRGISFGRMSVTRIIRWSTGMCRRRRWMSNAVAAVRACWSWRNGGLNA